MFSGNRKQTVEERKFVESSSYAQTKTQTLQPVRQVKFRFMNYHLKKQMASYPNTLDSAVGVCRDLRV